MHELTEKMMNKFAEKNIVFLPHNADKIITDWLEEKVDQLAFSLNHPSLEDHVVIEKILGLGPEKENLTMPEAKADNMTWCGHIVWARNSKQITIYRWYLASLQGGYESKTPVPDEWKSCPVCAVPRPPRPEKPSQDTIKLLMPEHAAYYKTEQIIDKLNEVIRAVNGSGGK